MSLLGSRELGGPLMRRQRGHCPLIRHTSRTVSKRPRCRHLAHDVDTAHVCHSGRCPVTIGHRWWYHRLGIYPGAPYLSRLRSTIQRARVQFVTIGWYSLIICRTRDTARSGRGSHHNREHRQSNCSSKYQSPHQDHPARPPAVRRWWPSSPKASKGGQAATTAITAEGHRHRARAFLHSLFSLLHSLLVTELGSALVGRAAAEAVVPVRFGTSSLVLLVSRAAGPMGVRFSAPSVYSCAITSCVYGRPGGSRLSAGHGSRLDGFPDLPAHPN